MRFYIYKPLEVDEIRLLELHYGDIDAELESKLHVYRLPEDEEPEYGHEVLVTRDGGFSVPNVPKYRALSYTWGTDATTRSLKVLDGGNFSQISIKPNLDNALRQLRKGIPHNSSELFWIDAICINQDDIPEKNTQIKKMAMIYNRADTVAVWLGLEDNDSHMAMSFIKKLLKLNDFDPLTQDPGTPPEWSALLNLMQRQWFNRRWIVQEIALARRATIFCGNQSVSWQDFSSAVALFVSRYQDLRRLFRSNIGDAQAYPDLLGEVDALGAKALVDITNNLFRKSDDGVVLERLLSLEALISSLTAFEASSPHDTIYAVLWLAHDAEPDSKEPAAMSQDAVMRTPERSPDINPAPSPSPDPDEEMISLKLEGDSVPPQNVIPRTSRPGADRRSLSPSRIETHSSVPEREAWLKPPTEHIRTLSGRSATDGNLRKAEKHFEDDPEPIIVDYQKEVYEVCRQFLEFAITRSKSLDIICHPWAPEPPKTESGLPSWITPVSNSPFERKKGQNTYVRVHADPLVGTPGTASRNYNASGKTKPYPNRGFIVGRTLLVTGFILDAIKVKKGAAIEGIIPSDWLELVGWKGPPDPVPDRFWRTLVADRGAEGHKQPPAYFPLACKWVFEQSDGGGQVDTSKILANGKCPSIVTEFLRRMQAVVWGRRLALSEGRRGSKQLLSLVPLEAEEGDLICIVYGCSVPVILRRRKKRKNESTPVFSWDSTGVGSRSSDSQENIEFSVPQMKPAPGSRDSTNTPQTDITLMPSSAGLTVPTESPISTFSSRGVRKVLGEESQERKPPSLTVSLDSQYQYSFVGECYVHGMMAGEGFKHQNEHGNSLRVFHLA